MDEKTITDIVNFINKNPNISSGRLFLKDYYAFCKTKIMKRKRTKRKVFDPESYYKAHLENMGFDGEFLDELTYVGKVIENEEYCCMGFTFSLESKGKLYHICISIEVPYVSKESIVKKALFPLDKRDNTHDIYVLYWIFDENKKREEYNYSFNEISSRVFALLKDSTKNVHNINFSEVDTFNDPSSKEFFEIPVDDEIIKVPDSNVYRYEDTYDRVFISYKMDEQSVVKLKAKE